MKILVGLPVLILLNIPIFKLLFKLFFADKNDFNESLYFLFRFDIVSLFKGEILEDIKAELKIKFFFALCISLIVVEGLIIIKLTEYLAK